MNFLIKKLCCEHRKNPIGIDNRNPRFSWQIKSDKNGSEQKSYRICVKKEDTTVWDSGVTLSDNCISVEYGGEPLKICTRYDWSVTVTAKDGSEATESSYFETGLFGLEDWEAGWITAKGVNGPIYARSEFKIKDSLLSARLFTAGTTGAHGSTTLAINCILAKINGKKIGKDVMSPGQISSRKWRAMYRMYDVTEILNSGINVFTAVTLSMAFSACLYLNYKNGKSEVICFDKNSLKIKTQGPFTLWEYGVKEHGGKSEYYDSNKEFKGWEKPDFDMSDWKVPEETDVVTVLSEQKATAEVIEVVRPVRIYQNPYTRYVADFGENMHGHIHLRFDEGQPTKKVTVRYSERIYPDGELNPSSTINYNAGETGPHTDTYIPRGGLNEEYSPTFSNHGFRYAEILKFPGVPKEGDICAHRVHTPMASKSYFKCSDDDINKLFRMSYNSQRANLVTVPTDCPHRERLGWLGDQVCFAESECINFNLLPLFEGYFETVRDDRYESGALPYISPFPDAKEDWIDIPWNTGCILVPWYVYDIYGDTRILTQCYPMMKKWLSFVEKSYMGADGIVRGGICWNDHTARTFMNNDYLSTLYYYISAVYTAKTAKVLELEQESKYYLDIAQNTKTAINKKFWNKNGYSANSQADNAHALNFSIADGEQKELALKTLIDTLEADDKLLTCGCLGINNIIPALAENGRNDIVFELCKDKRNGSWGGWSELLGATTSLEYLSCDQVFSMNHPFLMGSITTWFYEHLAGIKRIAPAFKHFKISPFMPKNMKWAEATVDSPFGEINFRWERQDNVYLYTLDIPSGTTAEVHLPTTDITNISELSGYILSDITTKENTVSTLPSGHYEFLIK